MLLIDEVDRADDDFEAFLLELLAEHAVTIPELGTIRATHPPIVVLTSNRTRELHDALKRRCLFHWIDYPDPERSAEIIRRRVPGSSRLLAQQVAETVDRLRALELQKPPGIAEAIDWVGALELLGVRAVDADGGPHAGVGAEVRRGPAAGPRDGLSQPGRRVSAAPALRADLLALFGELHRHAGVPVSSAQTMRQASLELCRPTTVDQLYWCARVSLLRSVDSRRVRRPVRPRLPGAGGPRRPPGQHAASPEAAPGRTRRPP